MTSVGHPAVRPLLACKNSHAVLVGCGSGRSVGPDGPGGRPRQHRVERDRPMHRADTGSPVERIGILDDAQLIEGHGAGGIAGRDESGARGEVARARRGPVPAHRRNGQGGSHQARHHRLHGPAGRERGRGTAGDPGSDLEPDACRHPRPRDPCQQQRAPGDPVEGGLEAAAGSCRGDDPADLAEPGVPERQSSDGEQDHRNPEDDEQERKEGQPGPRARTGTSPQIGRRAHGFAAVTPASSTAEADADTGSESIPTKPRMSVPTR